MTERPPGGMTLRIAAIVLIVIGLVLHLWLGMMSGLGVVVVGVAAHVTAGVLGRRWIRQRDRPGRTEP